MQHFKMAALILGWTVLLPTVTEAAIQKELGPYSVRLTSNPSVIPSSGPAKLSLRIYVGGKPAAGLNVSAIARMPGMPMGEREQPALEQKGSPGHYLANANFPMGGSYEIGIKISGHHGTAVGVIPVQTGMDTSRIEGFDVGKLALWVGVAMLALFALVRTYRTGQKPNWQALTSRSTLIGLATIAVMLAIAVYAVRTYRRAGSMTPIEAQAMEMNTPAPPGTHAVELAPVTRGVVHSAVTYSGQAVAFTEVDVQPRVQGWITEMTVYQGDRVRRGQVIARLDTSQIAPQEAERRAMVTERERGVEVAQSEYLQATEEADQAHAEVAIRRAAVEEARANLEAARQEKADATTGLSTARSMVAEAESMIESARADQRYRQESLGRAKQLYDKGALSKEEYQKERSEAQMADAKTRQAKAGVARAESEVRSAQAGIRKADAMIWAAQKKVAQMQAELTVHNAHVRSTNAAADAARKRIDQARAGVAQAEAGLRGVTTTRGYSELRSPVDGVIMQRLISPGTLVNPGQAVLRAAQIEPIRLQANVPTSDLARIKVGTPVVVGEREGGRNPLNARVTSITPAVDPGARTGIVEALTVNRDRRFLPGQFVSMSVSLGRSERVLRIPNRVVKWRSAVSNVEKVNESRPYVWIADSSGQGLFTARQAEITLGVRGVEFSEVRSGLEEGDHVIASGAESLRSGDMVAASNPPTQSVRAVTHSGVQEASVEVSSAGFKPAALSLKRGVPAKITFTRISEDNCGTEVLIPEYGINTPLPLNEPVVVELNPRAGEFTFSCGMDMLKGKLVVQ